MLKTDASGDSSKKITVEFKDGNYFIDGALCPSPKLEVIRQTVGRRLEWSTKGAYIIEMYGKDVTIKAQDETVLLKYEFDLSDFPTDDKEDFRNSVIQVTEKIEKLLNNWTSTF